MAEPDTRSETSVNQLIKRLIRYNSWRRGEIIEQFDPWNIEEDVDKIISLLQSHQRLQVLAIKHCPREHHDWPEIVKLADDA